jgi:hypothetical protein
MPVLGVERQSTETLQTGPGTLLPHVVLGQLEGRRGETSCYTAVRKEIHDRRSPLVDRRRLAESAHVSPVDRLDLMRQWLDCGGLHRRERIEEMGKLDATRLGRKLEGCTIGIKRPSALVGNLEAGQFLVGNLEAGQFLGGNLEAGRFLGGDESIGDVPALAAVDDVRDPGAVSSTATIATSPAATRPRTRTPVFSWSSSIPLPSAAVSTRPRIVTPRP